MEFNKADPWRNELMESRRCYEAPFVCVYIGTRYLPMNCGHGQLIRSTNGIYSCVSVLQVVTSTPGEDECFQQCSGCYYLVSTYANEVVAVFSLHENDTTTYLSRYLGSIGSCYCVYDRVYVCLSLCLSLCLFILLSSSTGAHRIAISFSPILAQPSLMVSSHPCIQPFIVRGKPRSTRGLDVSR